VLNPDWNFFGNPLASAALAGMVERQRIPQTLLLAGPEGIGKATLARRFAAVVSLAKCLEIVRIPHKRLIAPVRLDMVDVRSEEAPALE